MCSSLLVESNLCNQWQEYHITRLILKAAQLLHRGTLWCAASLYQPDWAYNWFNWPIYFIITSANKLISYTQWYINETTMSVDWSRHAHLIYVRRTHFDGYNQFVCSVKFQCFVLIASHLFENFQTLCNLSACACVATIGRKVGLSSAALKEKTLKRKLQYRYPPFE